MYGFRFLVHLLPVLRMIFMGLLASLRFQVTKQNQSAFEINGNKVFMIIVIVALFAFEVTSAILFLTNIYSNMLKLSTFFWAFLASFSLTVVLIELPPNHNSLVYVLVCATLGIAALCYNDDENLPESPPVCFTFIYWRLVLVPLSLLLVLFVPKSLNWMPYSVICLSLGIEFISIFINCYKVQQMAKNMECRQVDKNNNDLEAQQVVEHDDNNHTNY